MKKSNPLIILLFLVLIFKTYSQEKQNDATWEETIDFIKDNIKAMRGRIIWDGYTKSETIESNLSSREILEITNHWEIGKLNFIEIKRLDLNDLYSAYITMDGEFTYLTLNSKYNVIDVQEGNKKSTSNHIRIGVGNNDMMERFSKALKHLAYLGNIKNEEKRLKSKF